jgi:predicted small lipoprotein YifL
MIKPFILLAAMLALSGCGLKGNLTLPDHDKHAQQNQQQDGSATPADPANPDAH